MAVGPLRELELFPNHRGVCVVVAPFNAALARNVVRCVCVRLSRDISMRRGM